MKERTTQRFQQLAIDIAFGRVSAGSQGGSGTGTVHGDGVADGHVGQNIVLRDKPVDGRHCGSCTVELSPGTRWWICGVCGRECMASIHPSYVRKREMWNADVESGGGGGADH
jgi:hypothetical protein